MAISAHRVADYFLALGDENEAVSNLKLQKLLYYAQGFALALTGKPLFDEPIHAWAHGPVVRDVYFRFNEFGSAGIVPDGEQNFDDISQDDRALLNDVWTTYGQYSAWRLRDMTHDEPPWQKTPQKAEISHGLMTDYFRTQIQE